MELQEELDNLDFSKFRDFYGAGQSGSGCTTFLSRTHYFLVPFMYFVLHHPPPCVAANVQNLHSFLVEWLPWQCP